MIRLAPNRKLITCILPHGIAHDLLEALDQELGIVEGNVNNARGTGRLAGRKLSGLGSETEKEMLNVVVPADRADEVFAFVFERARINRPHGGIIFMSDLVRATPFELPDLPAE